MRPLTAAQAQGPPPSGPAISGPAGIPLLGSLPEFWRDRLAFLTRCRQQYGRTVLIRLGRPAFLLNEPADIEHVLVTGSERYDKSWQNTQAIGKRFYGRALFSAKRRAHLPLRRAVNPAFHRLAIGAYADAVVAEAERRAIAWQDRSTVDVWSHMRGYAQDALVRAVFGPAATAPEEPLGPAVRRRREFLGRYFDRQWLLPHLWPDSQARAFRRADAEFNQRVDAFISRPAPEGSLYHALLQLNLSREAVRAEILELLNSGYETTSEALTWGFVCLARNPTIADRLAAECGPGPLDPHQLLSLPYAEQCFAEILRLYPPSWLFVRTAVEPDRLPSAAQVPRGAKILLSPYLAHRDPEIYPDPERFDPERFDPAVRYARPRFSYYPFGGGVRVCLGEAFARLEALAALTAICGRWSLELEPDQDLRPIGRITLQPRGPVRLRVRAR